MRKTFIALSGAAILGFGIALLPLSVTAQTTVSTSTQALLDQISVLIAQLNNLQQQIDALKTEQKEIKVDLKSTISELRDQLEQGDKNDDVAVLQALLAADPEIYPEGLITGYYGQLTRSAVVKLQKKHGLETPGRVGPKTLSILNKLLKEHPVAFENDDEGQSAGIQSTDSPSSKGRAIGKMNRLCAIVPPGHLIAPGWKKMHGGVLVIPECQVLPPGIDKKVDVTPSPTPSPTSTPSVTPTPTSSPTPTPSPTPSPTPTPTPSPTPTPTETPSPSPTP